MTPSPSLNRAGEPSRADASWWNRGIAPFLLLALASIFVDLHHLAQQQPIIDDRAYLTYMAQVVFRGESLYGSTTFGYPPFAPLMTAGVMWIGALFDAPTYLSPRFASLVLGATNACLVFAIGRRAFGCAWTGLFAGLMLTGFRFANILDATSLEAKTLVMLFMLCGMIAVQKQKWILAGAAAGVATMLWQPAIVICVSLGIALLAARFSMRVLGRFTAGVGLGFLPAVIYPIVRGEWHDFYYLTVIRKLALNIPSAGDRPFKWPVETLKYTASEAFVVLFAIVGLALYLHRRFSQARDGERKGEGERKAFPVEGGLLALTFAWAVFNSVDFESGVDFVPCLPLLALWGAYGYRRALGPIARRVSPGRTLTVATLLLASYLFEDEFRYTTYYKLPEQVALVRDVLGENRERGGFIALDGEEFYVLSNTAAPFRYTRADSWVDSIAARLDPGAGTVLELAKALSPELIVVKQKRNRESSPAERYEAVFYPEYELSTREIPYPSTFPPPWFFLPEKIYDRNLYQFRRSTPRER